MKIITIIIWVTVSTCVVTAQNYKIKIKQGVNDVYAETVNIDSLSFKNTATNPFVCGDALLYGGELYPTGMAAGKCWFLRNLNIGTRINGGVEQTNNNIIEKYCYSDRTGNCVVFGGLYQWAEVVNYQNGATNTTTPVPEYSGNIQGICPAGWHIPNQTEIGVIETAYPNTISVKASGEGYVDVYTTGGSNSSGFSVLLAGGYYPSRVPPAFANAGNIGSFWGTTTDPGYSNKAYRLSISSASNVYSDVSVEKNYSISVRCIQD